MVIPLALIFESLRYCGSSPKIRRLQGALLVMRFDRSLNSFFVRAVAAEVLCRSFEVPDEYDGTVMHDGEGEEHTFCRVDNEEYEGGDGDVVIASLRSRSMERLVRMKTSRGISFFPGNLILLLSL